VLRGATVDLEFEQFQKRPTELFMYFTRVEDEITLNENELSLTRAYVTSIDMNKDAAALEMNIALKLINQGKHAKLYMQHTRVFNKWWQQARIEVDNLELQRVIYASIYYIMSSLPSLEHHGQLNPFFGLSPGSLSRGALSEDYLGHAFWDMGIIE
jgi:protein-glucosylgalactosylhydroxylysine glucosidase